MNAIKKIMMAITVLLSITVTTAQIKNAKTETVKIYGNCGMCKTTIEKAGNLKKVAKVDWNEDTQEAILTYDAQKTNQEEILKRIALAGYDSNSFLAPETAYNALPGCCQYERKALVAVAEPKNEPMKKHGAHGMNSETLNQEITTDQLKPVFDNYFLLKDALVETDSKATSSVAKDLLASITAVKMEELTTEAHVVWMKIMKDLITESKSIFETQDIKKQRTRFMSLSKNMHDLIKIATYETPIFYQFCPMANDGKGANWLSKDHTVKNPYYGSQMLNCGKTVEIIK